MQALFLVAINVGESNLTLARKIDIMHEKNFGISSEDTHFPLYIPSELSQFSKGTNVRIGAKIQEVKMIELNNLSVMLHYYAPFKCRITAY